MKFVEKCRFLLLNKRDGYNMETIAPIKKKITFINCVHIIDNICYC